MYFLYIAIIDARSIANAYWYGVTYAWSGLLECADLHPVPLKGKCQLFCFHKAVQIRICKIAVRYDLQKYIIFSYKMNRNPRYPLIFQLMVYKCGR